ncbi:S-adenosyl-L-methionine-dependent methyltransferase [Rhypophila decipiens]
MDDNGRETKPQTGDTLESTMTGNSTTENEQTKTRRGKPIHTTPKPKKPNPISAAISSWLHEARPDLLTSPKGEDTPSIEIILIEKAPKRWVVYEPMVLLPSGSFTSSPWPSILNSSTAEQKSILWANILREISPSGALTHLAINEGIPLHVGDAESKDEDDSDENTLRSPSGLKILHGDFGPVLQPNQTPTAQDFENAFWVSTKQNGITQIWAPRYTMFSRGNIKEKARLLTDFPAACSVRPNPAKLRPEISSNSDANKELLPESAQDPDREQGINEGRQTPKEKDQWAIDLYAGIGYFVFSYAKLGFRLLCWEINPWSVEGLRRGALANRWDVVVLSPPPISSVTACVTGEPGSHLGSGPDNGPTPGQATDDDPVGDENDRKLAELVIGNESSTHTSTTITTNNLQNDRDESTHSNSKRRNAPGQRPQIIVLLESNEFAEGRVRQLRKFISSQFTGSSSNPEAQIGDPQGSVSTTTSSAEDNGTEEEGMEIVHINAGFLPSSSKIWPSAWKMMVSESDHHTGRKMVDGWLHLHENVGVREIEKRKAEIQGLFDEWSGSAAAFSAPAEEVASTGEVMGQSNVEGKGSQEQKGNTQSKNSSLQAQVVHVEMVKTFAPDVWHVVFDVRVTTTI